MLTLKIDFSIVSRIVFSFHQRTLGFIHATYSEYEVSFFLVKLLNDDKKFTVATIACNSWTNAMP